MSKEDRLRRKQYHKMLKQHKKAIMRAAKHAANDPFDAEPGLVMFIEHLKFMKDYYELGYNVWAEEVEGHRSRLDGLKDALQKYDLAYDQDNIILNKYYNYSDQMEPKVVEKLLNGKKITALEFPEGYGKPLNGLTFEEAAQAYEQELIMHKKEFYDIIIEELEYWWD